MEILKTINFLLSKPLIALIWVYQRTLSPDHGLLKGYFPYGYCKFHPTCSEYALQVLKKQGIVGIPRIINRIIKCRPGIAPAVDLP